MRIVVTGLGFIGTNLIKRLVSDGHEVDCLDYSTQRKKEHEHDGCNYIKVDVSDGLRRHDGILPLDNQFQIQM